MNNHPFILFIPHNNASFAELLQLCKIIQKQQRYKPLFLIHWHDWGNSVAACEANGFQYQLYSHADQKKVTPGIVIENKKHKSVSQPVTRKTRLKSRIKQLFAAQFGWHLVNFISDKLFARKILFGFPRFDALFPINFRGF